jgi:Ca-activated chloride channel family protein
VRLAALFAVVAALLVGAAPASAQDPEPVVGAGSFTTAPILEPGTYRDTVLPEEYLYYGVRVAAGQRLRATLKAGLTSAEFSDLGIGFVQVNLHGPDRVQLFDATGPEGTGGSDTAPADTTSPEARSLEQARTSVSSGWQGPGVYFIAVYGVFVGSGELTKAEIPFTLTVAVEGQAQAEPSPSPTPTPSPTAAATASPAATPDEGDDSTPAVAAGAGVGGLLIGVVGGIVLRRRRG